MADLKLDNISKSFSGVQALDEANFEASFGEVHAILGENGAGKSTLIKILSGAIRHDSGEIIFKGEKLNLKSPDDAMKVGIGTVYQELSLIRDLNVYQNLFFQNWPSISFGMVSKKILRTKTREVFARYNIEGIDPDTKICDLSLSQQQVIEILKVLVRDPQIVIFDEATSALSEDFVEWLLKLGKQIAAEGKIVLFISHRMPEIKYGCDRVTIFRNGKDVGVRMIKNADEDELVSLMLGRRLESYFPKKMNQSRDEIMLDIKNWSVDNHLKNVNLSIRCGEVLGVGGLAGQGQIPLFLSLFGILKGKGEILLKGKKVEIKCPEDSLKNGIALVPEDRSTQGLFLAQTLRENISLPNLRRITKSGLIQSSLELEMVNKICEKLRVKAESCEARVMELSGGNQQKVLLAKFLLTEPKLLLLFDTTRGVDVGTKVEIFNLIRQLASQGNAILFFSTDVMELVNVCDRVVIMRDKKMCAILEEKDLFKESIIKECIGAC